MLCVSPFPLSRSESLLAYQTIFRACRIPDIIRHMADVIVQAESEVFLATSAYQPSPSAEPIIRHSIISEFILD
jgi:hypothetical protein